MRIRQRKRTDTDPQKESDTVVVKEEPQDYSQDDDDEEDRLPISQILLSRRNRCDSSSPIETQVMTGAIMDDGSVSIKKRARDPIEGTSSRVKEASDKLVESEGCKSKKEAQKVSGPFEAQCSLLMKRAKEFQAKLSPKFPSVVRLLSRSHVTRGFWLGLPTKFCKLYLPKISTIFVLEDESGDEYEAKYLAERWALSGGWKRYSLDHKLVEGDIAIFHLIKPDRFKVYTIKADDAFVKESETGPVAADFEDFKISVNGLVLDPELSRELRISYHKLCCSQKSYLHSNLVKSVDESALAARIIFKTVHIANAIRSCDFSASQHDLAKWDKTLKVFEEMGMEVGFLRERIKRLASLALDVTAGSKRYEEARVERDRAENKMKSLELDFLELKESYGRLEGEKKKAKLNARKYEVMFEEEANAPW